MVGSAKLQGPDAIEVFSGLGIGCGAFFGCGLGAGSALGAEPLANLPLGGGGGGATPRLFPVTFGIGCGFNVGVGWGFFLYGYGAKISGVRELLGVDQRELRRVYERIHRQQQQHKETGETAGEGATGARTETSERAPPRHRRRLYLPAVALLHRRSSSFSPSSSASLSRDAGDAAMPATLLDRLEHAMSGIGARVAAHAQQHHSLGREPLRASLW